jgi:hypothetical protein
MVSDDVSQPNSLKINVKECDTYRSYVLPSAKTGIRTLVGTGMGIGLTFSILHASEAETPPLCALHTPPPFPHFILITHEKEKESNQQLLSKSATSHFS